GPIVGAAQDADGDEIKLISDKGTLERTRVDEVSVQGRNTQGVRLIRLKDGEKLVGLEAVQDPEEGLSEVNESEDSQSAVENRESDDAGDAQG
ncbi:MAG: DNA gyrase C-terminal beta-propeller domain-containing protein, partial [Pseudomonadota bacterium]|nr:DNA gyrase C-terminal beta-propeller domain-containing protein [Pseudomonadota bacterium]